MNKLQVFKKGKMFVIKVYGKEWELIMPEEEKAEKKFKKSSKSE